MSARRSRLLVGALVLAAGVGALPREANAYPFERRLWLRGEGTVAFLIGATEVNNHYATGVLARAFVGLTLIDPVSIQVSALEGIFPSRTRPTSLNTNFTLGLRFEPRTVRPEGRMFVDFNAGLTTSGFNQRFAFDFGFGWEFQLSRFFYMGPVVRYSHVVQPDDLVGMDADDAHYISLGLSIFIRPFPTPVARRGRLVVIGLGNEPDGDYDGVPDSLDQCPQVVEDHDGFDDEDGCPDLDDDSDTLPDSEDRCPRAAENVNGYEDEDGCPDALPGSRERIEWNGNEIRLRQRVYFAVGRWQVPPLFNPILTELGDFLVAHPEIRRLRVEGHADDRGTRREGFSLSLRRAQSVVAFLAERGVSAARLEAVGFGDTAPLDRAHDEVTRARNRRIEFIIGEGPLGRAPALPEGVWTPATNAVVLPSPAATLPVVSPPSEAPTP
ncbi:MAG: cell envelope biosis protein OmpA [Myxococcaceae bacterium]|nr:cell envelope biosis protein OmpA [Myxococcaceae bacterium]